MIRTETVPGFTSDMASINRVRLHYLLGGNRDGPPVLLWHGFLSTGYAWRKVMPALVDAGFAVLVPDMRGYGDSDKPAGTEGYDARALAEEFRALVREIGFGAGRPLTLVLAPLRLFSGPQTTRRRSRVFCTLKCRSCSPKFSPRSLLTPPRP
jgi:hypothetical protein